MSTFAHITGWGMSVPEKVLTNQELAETIDSSDEWIVSHTGIRARHVAGPGETTATLATEAARRALDMANLDPDQLELIIVSTSSPEHTFPATACIVQDQLGASRAGAFDLSAACSGFIFALNMATLSIRSGAIRNALVIGAETLSRLVNWKDRNTCILFGDGAGAFVLQASEERGGLVSAVMHSDGSGCDLLSVPAGGSRIPASLESVSQDLHFIQMNGREVFRFASRVMVSATQEVLKAAKLTMDDIQLVVPHQANQRIIEAAARGLDIPLERCYLNLERYGNTSTASIPIAMVEAIEDGRIQPGDRLVMVGFGAGLTWGAALVEWSGQEPSPRHRIRPRSYRWYGQMRSLLLRGLRRVDASIGRVLTPKDED